ncbi:MAG TPA: hypothetical protein VNQ55_05490 [Parapedobacter sp.]|nr:hypothetical protein [Parapedobacter sp.]
MHGNTLLRHEYTRRTTAYRRSTTDPKGRIIAPFQRKGVTWH